MNSKNVTMQTIANRLGVTKVTVSKAINNQPGVSDNLKQKILKISQELGYNKKAKKNQTGQVKNLAFLVSKRFFLESDNFYTQIYYYISSDCIRNDINLSLYIVDKDDEDSLIMPFLNKKDELGGLFMAGEFKDQYIRAIVKLDIPVIAIDFYKPHIDTDCVITDNFYASYLAAIHLIDSGHRKIGFVGDPHYTSSVTDRFYGFLKAVKENGLEYRDEWNIVNNDSSGVYIMDYSLPENLPTAFICHCDMAAWHIMQKFKTVGISVPEQVSLVSFDNTELSRNCTPPLTTIDINKREFAYKSMQQMFWRLNNKSSEPQRVYLSTHLIERESVIKIP